MFHPTGTDVRQQLIGFIDHVIDVRTLWHWLMKEVVAPEVDRADSEVRAVSGPALLYMSEHQAGHRTDEELRRLLRTLATTYVRPIDLGGANNVPTRILTSSSSTLSSQMMLRGVQSIKPASPLAEIPTAMVFA